MGELVAIKQIVDRNKLTYTTDTKQTLAELEDEQYHELRNTVNELVIAYQSLKIDPLTVGVYAADLAKFPLKDVKEAIRAIRLRLKYFPSVAEIVEIVVEIQEKRITERAQQQTRKQLDFPRVRTPMPDELKQELISKGLFREWSAEKTEKELKKLSLIKTKK